MTLKNKMAVLLIVGARPQFIKAAMICKGIAKYIKSKKIKIESKVLHTGQHYDNNMSKIFFKQLNIKAPDYNLGIHGMKNGSMIGRMIEGIEKILTKEMPDLVIVFGDTNSTIAGTIASKSNKIRVAHVEAGLRSYNINMIEEQNRVVTDRLSDLIFCPTKIAVENLKKEGITSNPYKKKLVNVGDVMYDYLIFYSKLLPKENKIIRKINLKRNNYILATIHRAENTDDKIRLKNIISSLNEISFRRKIVLPIHPRTKKMLMENKISASNIKTIPPISYLYMLGLEKDCCAIVTDSGGIQKEAYFFKKPCITIRSETEWAELVEAGVNFLVDANDEEIRNKVEKSFTDKFNFNKKFYGNGEASDKIVNIIFKFVKEN
jgi:UDP-GlcNAc3NAcA epimerase